MAVWGVDYQGDTACLCNDGLCEDCSALARRLLAAEKLADTVETVRFAAERLVAHRTPMSAESVERDLSSALLAWKEAGK